MKLYVAGSSKQLERCKRVMRAISEAGHRNAMDWTTTFTPEKKAEALLNPRLFATVDLDAITASDAIILLATKDNRGALVEYGYALGLGKPAIIVGECDDDDIFVACADVRVFDDRDVVLGVARLEAILNG